MPPRSLTSMVRPPCASATIIPKSLSSRLESDEVGIPGASKRIDWPSAEKKGTVGSGEDVPDAGRMGWLAAAPPVCPRFTLQALRIRARNSRQADCQQLARIHFRLTRRWNPYQIMVL